MPSSSSALAGFFLALLRCSFSWMPLVGCLLSKLWLLFFRIQKIPRLLVGASDGYLYMYNLDPQEGGECALMRQHR